MTTRNRFTFHEASHLQNRMTPAYSNHPTRKVWQLDANACRRNHSIHKSPKRPQTESKKDGLLAHVEKEDIIELVKSLAPHNALMTFITYSTSQHTK
jgi:hypothetical protein